jgi:hypothetical protein
VCNTAVEAATSGALTGHVPNTGIVGRRRASRKVSAPDYLPKGIAGASNNQATARHRGGAHMYTILYR